eukprot:1916219-Pyramimonas_sp.AAC.1
MAHWRRAVFVSGSELFGAVGGRDCLRVRAELHLRVCLRAGAANLRHHENLRRRAHGQGAHVLPQI